jgi:elongation factor P
MITAGELRRGITIELDGELFTLVDFQHNKTGRGGAVVRLKVRNVRSGYTTERTFSASEKYRRVYLDHRQGQYQYNDEGLYYFMDMESFEQVALGKDQVGDDASYLKDGLVVDILTYQSQPIGLELPITVDLAIAETEPGFKGDTATGGNKPAVLETGAKIQVPLFVAIGDVIRVDTRTGQYLERVS